MFNLPAETFWWLVPWPLIWMALAIILYFKHKREDEREGQHQNNTIDQKEVTRFES
ncbi:hypothetical protein J2S00_001470 [Caldalkalibacillus uzonensis]|uniref:Uncharacterized protein n=1 Tax=Caldalkalibacillus uzonensis TaxID=353224 RepID=A0ABU0CQM9_9BACI|nr:hypothetical protein [Caldalkalibacillus uzonensis]MDQ0338684.1 hypothetical protein [Caldalkalibacillus uzonensis]